jgi:methylglutaconyl-CoA hydratase
MNDALQIERSGAVLTLWLNRPELHNAFDAGLIARLTAALEAAGRDDSVRAVVVAGHGASFSAGADMQWMRGMAAASEADNREDSLALARLMRTLDELPKPTLARVHGAAFGGGVGLVACCDIAIASTSARFGLTESRLGLLPAVISPYVIEAIGPRQARRWFATGEHFDADTALRIGLVHQLVEPERLDEAVQRQLALLDKAGPIASSTAKQLVRQVRDSHDRDALDRDNAALIARLRVSAEGQEGLGAFLDKRAPIGSRKPEHARSSWFDQRRPGAQQDLLPAGAGAAADRRGDGSDRRTDRRARPHRLRQRRQAVLLARQWRHRQPRRARGLRLRQPRQVDAFHAAALAAGGRDNGAPGLRPWYHPDYYGAFVLDPDGNNIEAVCHRPADGVAA